MSGLWLFLIAPSGAIWRLDKNPSVHQLEFVNLGLPSMKQQWKHQATQDQTKIILQPIFYRDVLFCMLIFQARCGADISNLVAAVANGPAAGIATTSATWMPKNQIFHPPGCLDPVNLGFCGLISCNWAQGLCWSPRTSIWIAPWTHCTIGLGLVGWDGLVQTISVIHPNSRNVYIALYTYLALSYTSSLSPLQNPSGFPSFWCAGHLQVVAPKRRFTLTRFVCCQPHVSEVAKTQPLREAEFLKPARYISQNINLKHEGHMDQAYGSFWTKHIDQIYERSVVSIVSLAKQAMPELASCADVPRWKKGRSPDMSLEILDW